jgi:hypothetical protein
VTERIRDIPKEIADDLRALVARLDDLQAPLYMSVRMAAISQVPQALRVLTCGNFDRPSSQATMIAPGV